MISEQHSQPQQLWQQVAKVLVAANPKANQPYKGLDIFGYIFNIFTYYAGTIHETCCAIVASCV